jgi:hypothetical protein
LLCPQEVLQLQAAQPELLQERQLLRSVVLCSGCVCAEVLRSGRTALLCSGCRDVLCSGCTEVLCSGRCRLCSGLCGSRRCKLLCSGCEVLQVS